MASTDRIGLVQSRLRHDQRPFRMPLPDRAHNFEHRALFEIQRLHHREDEVGPPLAKADIGGRIVVDLAKSARIEKANDGGLRGKVEHPRRLRAGTKAAADLGIAGLRQLTNDGGLSALHLTKQPDDGRETTGPLGDGLLQIGGGAHEGL